MAFHWEARGRNLVKYSVVLIHDGAVDEQTKGYL